MRGFRAGVVWNEIRLRDGTENVVSSTRGQSSFTQVTDVAVREALLKDELYLLR